MSGHATLLASVPVLAPSAAARPLCVQLRPSLDSSDAAMRTLRSVLYDMIHRSRMRRYISISFARACAAAVRISTTFLYIWAVLERACN